MHIHFCEFTDVVGETVMINPETVRCVRATPNPKEVRIVFDKDHNVVVKSTLAKTMSLLTRAEGHPPAAAG